ncbi:hypothetical protein B0H14DRAFT_2976186 [Mycena olivaceomarginata]|nr:hypothetical protein B0H14DRAFT_2976186 [Mycena olivaceomarginata]
MIRNMDVFRRQGLLRLLGGDSALRCTAFAHSRLAPDRRTTNVSSLRVLQYPAQASPTGLCLLQSGNTTFHLGLLDALESTYMYLASNGSLTEQVVRDNMNTIETATEETWQNWLIALLGVLILLPNNVEKCDMVDIHAQYMTCLSAMEREAALQAGYTHSPLTRRSYQDMTTEFQFTVKLLKVSICDAIRTKEATFQIPSPAQYQFAKTLARLTAQWSAGALLMDYVSQKRFGWYYGDVVASLRRDFSSLAEPALVPNYLPREISLAASQRRQELGRCGTTGESNIFILPLRQTPRIRYGRGPLTLKSAREFPSTWS